MFLSSEDRKLPRKKFASRLIDGDDGFARIRWGSTHVGFFKQAQDDIFRAKVARQGPGHGWEEQCQQMERTWRCQKHSKRREEIPRPPPPTLGPHSIANPTKPRQSATVFLTIINRLPVLTKVSRGHLESSVSSQVMQWRAFCFVGLVTCLKLEVILVGCEFGHCNVLQVCIIGGFMSLRCWSGAIVRCSPMSFSFVFGGFVFKIGGPLGGCWVWAWWC